MRTGKSSGSLRETREELGAASQAGSGGSPGEVWQSGIAGAGVSKRLAIQARNRLGEVVGLFRGQRSWSSFLIAAVKCRNHLGYISMPWVFPQM